MKHISLVFLFVVISNTFSFGQNDPAYTAKLRQMFAVSGSEQTYKAAIENMFSLFRKQKTTVPDTIWAEYQSEFLKTSMDDLVTMLEPVYSKHMSLEDINQLIAFYETPVGKKFATKTPLIMAESMQVGQQWGMKIAEQFQERLKAKGY